MTKLLKVGVWSKLSTGWGKAGEIATWSQSEVEPRYCDPGVWSLTAPLDEQTSRLAKNQLLTFDLPRGASNPDCRLMTGVIEKFQISSDETGKPVVALTGIDALGLLGDTLAWPTPFAPPGSQAEYYTAAGVAETVLANLILANVVTRRGGDLTIPASTGRGSTITLNERFTNLLAIVTSKAQLGGLGVRMGLVETTSSTRAEMRLEFTTPVDRRIRVRLSHKVGTLRSWSKSDDVPTATVAIVGGGGTAGTRVFRRVADTAAEADWGRSREVFVDARDTTSTTELDARGTEALVSAIGQSSFDLESVEAEGLRYGTHFDLGDQVTVELLTGESYDEQLRAVKVTAGDSGLTVQLVPGNPDAGDPLLAQAALIRETRRRLGALERKE